MVIFFFFVRASPRRALSTCRAEGLGPSNLKGKTSLSTVSCIQLNPAQDLLGTATSENSSQLTNYSETSSIHDALVQTSHTQDASQLQQSEQLLASGKCCHHPRPWQLVWSCLGGSEMGEQC